MSNLGAGEPASFFRRLGEGPSGVAGSEIAGFEATALCMNFIVRSLEDMAFGAGPGEFWLEAIMTTT